MQLVDMRAQQMREASPPNSERKQELTEAHGCEIEAETRVMER